MSNFLDWTQLTDRVAKYRSRHSYPTDSLAFGHVFLETVFDITETEIAGCLTDGTKDRGIDAIFIDYRSNPADVHLLSFKYHAHFKGSKNNFPGSEINKICTFIDDLFSRRPFSRNSNVLIQKKVEEIYGLFTYEGVRFFVHLCSNGEKLTAEDQEKLINYLEEFKSITLLEYDLDSISTSLLTKNRRPVDGNLTAIGRPTFEKSDGNIRGLVITVTAGNLVSLLRDTNTSTQIKESIFPIIFAFF